MSRQIPLAYTVSSGPSISDKHKFSYNLVRFHRNTEKKRRNEELTGVK